MSLDQAVFVIVLIVMGALGAFGMGVIVGNGLRRK